jgi:hypothetical protein
MYLENTATIAAVVCNVVLLRQEIKQQNIGDSNLFEVHFVGSKVGDSVGGYDTLVAVDIDWVISRTDIVDMVWIKKKIYGALTVKEEEVGVDG